LGKGRGSEVWEGRGRGRDKREAGIEGKKIGMHTK